MNRTAKRIRKAIRSLVIVSVLAAPAAWAGETQVRFDVPEPFRVGLHTYAAGVIAVHSIMSYTPNTSLLEVWVNGDLLGMITANRSVSEVPPHRNEALFKRDDDGRLVMVGYRITGKPTGTTFRFQDASIQPAAEPGTPVALGSF